MPCFTPLRAWQSKPEIVSPKSGKRLIVFPTKKRSAPPCHNLQHQKTSCNCYDDIQLPCSNCEGCRIERARQWAVRCWHEASLHENNCFITLTFAPEHLDPDGSLRKPDFQKFMKRLRKHFSHHTYASCWKDEKTNRYKLQKIYYSPEIRYFHCGEYGEKFGRPHHHACLFNFKFPDQKLSRTTPQGHKCYTSDLLSELWPYGIHEIGEVTFQSAAYVARYIIKKVGGKNKNDHYQGKEPEYVTMSRRPGIAQKWFEKYHSDVYPDDFVVMDGGFKVLPPKYYDKRYELTNPQDFAIIKKKRIDRAKASPDNTPDRLKARHDILRRKLTKLKRGYENGT